MVNLGVKVTTSRLTGLFLLVFFLHALALNGVVLTKSLPVPGSESHASVIAFDVCGHAHPGVSFGGLDLLAAIPGGSFFIPSFNNGFPPSPDEAVATVDPGETGKPPEA